METNNKTITIRDDFKQKLINFKTFLLIVSNEKHQIEKYTNVDIYQFIDMANIIFIKYKDNIDQFLFIFCKQLNINSNDIDVYNKIKRYFEYFQYILEL